jgi:hypothetical protein
MVGACCSESKTINFIAWDERERETVPFKITPVMTRDFPLDPTSKRSHHLPIAPNWGPSLLTCGPLGKHLKFTEQQRNFQLEASERLP